jgi:hypothetical protein
MQVNACIHMGPQLPLQNQSFLSLLLSSTLFENELIIRALTLALLSYLGTIPSYSFSNSPVQGMR